MYQLVYIETITTFVEPSKIWWQKHRKKGKKKVTLAFVKQRLMPHLKLVYISNDSSTKLRINTCTHTCVCVHACNLSCMYVTNFDRERHHLV